LRKVILMVICLARIVIIFAQEETGVVINGITWATRNVDSVGKFAERSESPGMSYQWNKKYACPVKDGVSEWDATDPTGTTWEAINDPSPDGWRVPTRTEIEKLLDTTKVEYEWTTKNDVEGGRFTDKVTGKSIFLPATEWQVFANGTFYHGHYWSSEDANGYNAYHLFICKGMSRRYHSDYRFCFSIRPVKKT